MRKIIVKKINNKRGEKSFNKNFPCELREEEKSEESFFDFSFSRYFLSTITRLFNRALSDENKWLSWKSKNISLKCDYLLFQLLYGVKPQQQQSKSRNDDIGSKWKTINHFVVENLLLCPSCWICAPFLTCYFLHIHESFATFSHIARSNWWDLI